MSRLVDKRDLPIFIHSTIDDMTDLSPNAMRVYMHLARRADKGGVAWPSLQSIGDHCFKSVYKHPDSRRRHAIAALDELIQAGLIRKTERIGKDGQQSNQYFLLDPVTVASQPGVTVASQGAVTVESHTPVTVASHKDTPSEDTPIEGTPMDEGDEERTTRAAVIGAWERNIPGTMTEILSAKLTDLIDECGERAVMHGIVASVEAGVRNFRYIAACARNHASGKEPPSREPTARRQKARPMTKVDISMAASDELEAMLIERGLIT